MIRTIPVTMTNCSRYQIFPTTAKTAPRCIRWHARYLWRRDNVLNTDNCSSLARYLLMYWASLNRQQFSPSSAPTERTNQHPETSQECRRHGRCNIPTTRCTVTYVINVGCKIKIWLVRVGSYYCFYKNAHALSHSMCRT